jgi:hypothetical protein
VPETAIADDEALLGLRDSYLEAVAAGAETFTATFRPGVLGLDPKHPSGDISLAPPDAAEPPPIDVVLRSEALTVLTNLPLRVAARSVTIEGLAFVKALRPALRVTATGAIALTGIAVLDSQADPRQRAVVDLSAWRPGVTLDVVDSTFARSVAPDALLGCYVASGGWFERIRIAGSTLEGGTTDAVLAIEAVSSLELVGSLLGAGAARVLVRMEWPPKSGSISGCALSGQAGALIDVANPAPVPVEPVRVSDSRLTGDLPGTFETADSVERVDRASLDEAIAGAVAVADRRLASVPGPT